MTTKRMKLPDSLGGAEVEALEDVGLPMTIHGVPCAVVRVSGVGWVAVPKRALTEAKPPSPPEPGDGSVVRSALLAAADEAVRDESEPYAEVQQVGRFTYSVVVCDGPAWWGPCWGGWLVLGRRRAEAKARRALARYKREQAWKRAKWRVPGG